MSVRVRFAPSPTGPLHIGGLRTALYNYLLAKKNGGSFVLRIEDTDKKREVANSEEYILNSLSWLGLNPDEGPKKGGAYGPYRQSERGDLYRLYAQKLIDKQAAYYAFDSEEELKKARESFQKKGESFKYNIANRTLFKNTLAMGEKEPTGKKRGVIRLKVPENKKIYMEDEVRGKITVLSEEIEDKVLIKADGSPTYHFANVIDDHLMKISHVIRGEEWLPSLPVHKLIYDAFGWNTPKFMHLPLILNPVGQGKLSKRDGDKGGFPIFPIKWKRFSGYKEIGFLPESLINYLALLGWTPESEKEIFKFAEIIELFKGNRIHKGGARFNFDKAIWFNQKHIQSLSPKKLLERFPFFFKNINLNEKQMLSLISLTKERVALLTDFEKESAFFIKEPKKYDAKSVSKINKKEAVKILSYFSVSINENTFRKNEWRSNLLSWGKAEGVAAKEIMQTIRLALVGSLKGPDLFSITTFIGEKKVLFRVNAFAKYLKNKI